MEQQETPVFFSIIVPTYNRGHLISAAVDSILNQEYKNYEIIIVDDGSTDKTEKIVTERYGHLSEVKYIKQKNAERGAARNNGTKNAQGDYLNFFDSDDEMLPNHLTEAYNAIVENNFPPIFHLNYCLKTPETSTTILNAKTPKYANKGLISGSYLQPNTVLVRKDVVIANPFSEDRELAALEDWELWLRIACKHQILFVNQITTCLIHHDERSTITGNNDALVKRVNKFMNCVLNNNDIVTYYHADINKFKASCYTYIALHVAVNHNDPLMASKYLLKGIIKYPGSIFTRRFLAIIKHIIIKR